MKPAVFIGVSGGVADYSMYGDVNVVLVDWDNMEEAGLDDLEDALSDVADLPDGTPGKEEAIKDLNELITGVKALE